jgi:hypothetical protein
VDFAGGNLNVRIHSLMGKRRDELAELGKDFDCMAKQSQNLMSGQQRLLHDVSPELRSPLARVQAIVRNAIKYSPDRGVIKIALNVGPTDIHISVTDQGRWCIRFRFRKNI